MYESSYESGMKPFQPDPARGHWAHPNDFLYACWGLAFKMDVFSMAWYFFFEMGIYSLIPYLICLGLYVVPIVMIQIFLGQFSSSGFISAFRLAPIFKGIGYISWALNFSVLTYYSMFAAIPLLYFFHSLRPNLPWSCASFLQWANDIPNNGEISLCSNGSLGVATTTAATLVSNASRMDSNATLPANDYQSYQIPSVLFFRSHFDFEFASKDERSASFNFSWELLLCTLLVWTVVALIFHKFSFVEKMGRLIRITMWLLMGMLLVFMTRLLFLPYAEKAFKEFLMPPRANIVESFVGVPVAAVLTFGVGWGSIISLASHNHFKTDVVRFSWFICLGQMLIMALFGMAIFLVDRHFIAITNISYYSDMEEYWLLYLSIGSVIAEMELANMWSLLLYSMLLIAALLVIVTQIFAMLTALFDDFENLRHHKQPVTFGLIGALALFSVFFCSNHGLTYFTVLPTDALFTQIALSLLLLLVVVWVYGRRRFQRDTEFMLGKPFATWRVYVLRFIAPLSLLAALVICVVMAYIEHYLSSVAVYVVAIFLIGIPWLFIPGYALLRLLQTSGKVGMRFRRCCRSTDWYPVDPEHRQRYEEAMGNLDITHQLNEIGDEEQR